MTEEFPQYVDQMVQFGIDRLKNLQNDHTFNFAFATDTHHCTEFTRRALYAIREINREIPIAFTALGGDYLCNNVRTTREMALAQHGDLAKLISEYGKCPVTMVLKGNHDDNPFGAPCNRLMPDEIYDLLMTHHEKLFVTNPAAPKSMYGYYDIPSAKIRAIYLNPMDGPYEKTNGEVRMACDSMFSTEQLQWIANTALKMPGKGWGIAVFGHFVPLPAPGGLKDRCFGGDALWEVLGAFKDGGRFSSRACRDGLSYEVECDFTQQGPADILGYFCGHYHSDWIWKISNIPTISALAIAGDNFGTDPCSDGSFHKKTSGSGEESAFSIYTVDRQERRIWCVRCGAGPDYSFTF